MQEQLAQSCDGLPGRTAEVQSRHGTLQALAEDLAAPRPRRRRSRIRTSPMEISSALQFRMP